MAVSLIVSLAVLANTRSGLYSETDSDHAISINPLNSQARVHILTALLTETTADFDANSLRPTAIRGTALEPVDARYISFLGLIAEDEGNGSTAQTYYEAALDVLPVEIQALARKFVFLVEENSFREAVATAETIYRRWPQYLQVVYSQMPDILSDPEGYEEVVDTFGNLPGGPSWLVNALSEDESTISLVNRLVLDLSARGNGGLRPAINRLTARLINANNSAQAYQLFLNTLSDSEKTQSGYVFNGDFDLDPNGNLFDWSLRNQSGMDFSIINLPTENERALQVRFLDSPVRFNRPVIFTRLPPSQFTLTIDYSTSSLRGPNPVRLIVDCLQGRKKRRELASVEFAIGGSSDQIVNTDFTVPATDCDLQRLRLVNDNFVESWRNRYSGSLLLKSVSLTRNE